MGSLRRWSGWRLEILLALEVTALCALAVARPVLASFGDSPETFVARRADGATIVAFGLVVVLVPPLVLSTVALLTRLGGSRVRWWAHLAVVAGGGAVAVWRLVRDAAGAWPTPVVVAVGAVCGATLLLLRLRTLPTRSFLRFAGVASAIYLVQFLALSPTGGLVLGDDGVSVDDGVAADVSAALGEDPPDVVMLVFDALPLTTLLDGSGHVDAELFPNFAALAGTSTWYRNSTTVSMFTRDAVPAILTGRYPDPTNAPNDTPSTDPRNLFTLLAGSHDMQVREQITQLCPEEICPRPEPEGLGRLLRDAAELWRGSGDDEAGAEEFSLPALLDDDRYAEAEQWTAAADVARGGDPQLLFYHAALPHDPWQFLPDGRVYDTARYPMGYHEIGWYGPGIDAGRQRHVLQSQAADRLLGGLLDRLRAAGTFDDSLVVVTADHGQAFRPDTPWRWLDHDNQAELMWTPLLVKAPGQEQGAVVDDNVMSIDIVPTIADILGVDLPWPVDGIPADEADRRDPEVKYVDDDEDNLLRAAEGRSLVEIPDTRALLDQVLAADPVTAAGPDAVWRRTAHGDLVGRRVEQLDVAEASDVGEVAVADLDRLDDVDLDEPLPLEAIGRADLEGGAHVAYALNGTIGAVTEVEPDELNALPLVLGVLHPDVFVEGDNELTAYLVSGAPGDEVLRPLAVTTAG